VHKQGAHPTFQFLLGSKYYDDFIMLGDGTHTRAWRRTNNPSSTHARTPRDGGCIVKERGAAPRRSFPLASRQMAHNCMMALSPEVLGEIHGAASVEPRVAIIISLEYFSFFLISPAISVGLTGLRASLEGGVCIAICRCAVMNAISVVA